MRLEFVEIVGVDWAWLCLDFEHFLDLQSICYYTPKGKVKHDRDLDSYDTCSSLPTY